MPVSSKSPIAAPDVDEELLARLPDLYSKDDWFSARLAEAVQSERSAMHRAMAGLAGKPRRSNQGCRAHGRHSHDAATAGRKWRYSRPRVGTPTPIRAAQKASWLSAYADWMRRFVCSRTIWVLFGRKRPCWSITEFGRTAAMNGTRGTDHGTGGCAFLVGGAVRGGRVISDWPGLTAASLLDGRDLKPTLDLRGVFKGVLDEHLRIDAKTLAGRVFPDSTQARALDGLIRA